MTESASPRRLAFACSVGLALAASGCGKSDSVGAYQKELQMREKAVSSVEGVGGKMVEKHYPQMPGVKAWAVDLSGQQLTDATFNQLGKSGYITELNLSKTNLTDASMKRLNSIAGACMVMNLSDTDISDAGLGELNNLILLRELNLAGTKCTAAGVTALQKRIADNPNAKNKSPTVKLK